VVTRRAASAQQARKGWPFFVFIILIGLGLMTPFVLQAIRGYRIAGICQPTECQVIGEKTHTSSSTSRLGGHWYTTDSSHQEFSWSYTVDGTRYMAEGQEMGNIYPGVRMPCWYDPAAPARLFGGPRGQG